MNNKETDVCVKEITQKTLFLERRADETERINYNNVDELLRKRKLECFMLIRRLSSADNFSTIAHVF